MRGGIHCTVVYGALGSESTGRHVPPGVSWQTSERDRGEDRTLLEGGRPVLGRGLTPRYAQEKKKGVLGDSGRSWYFNQILGSQTWLHIRISRKMYSRYSPNQLKQGLSPS